MSQTETREPRWITDTLVLADLVAEISEEPAYALDTEFHGERSYHPQLALIQIGWNEGIALVDPFACDLAPLAALLAGPGTMIAHAGDQDLAILERAVGVTPSRYFDTQVAAGFCGMGVPSLANLAERTLGVKLTKGDRLTDWTRRPLNDDQRAYAAADVAHLHEITAALRAELIESGRIMWAEDECEERRQRDRSRADADTAWWRIKSSRQLRGATRGVAQTVAAWRERRAEQLDQPPRFILSDLALAGIVARPPKNREELAALRGIDGRSLREPVANELLREIDRGRNLPTDELRLPPREDTDRSLGPAVTVLSAWLSQCAGELRLEPALLATRSDLVELLNTKGGRLSHGWRAEIVGEPIKRLMAGDAAIALGDGGRRIELR
jgi:ribonuclease D